MRRPKDKATKRIIRISPESVGWLLKTWNEIARLFSTYQAGLEYLGQVEKAVKTMSPAKVREEWATLKVVEASKFLRSALWAVCETNRYEMVNVPKWVQMPAMMKFQMDIVGGNYKLPERKIPVVNGKELGDAISGFNAHLDALRRMGYHIEGDKFSVSIIRQLDSKVGVKTE